MVCSNDRGSTYLIWNYLLWTPRSFILILGHKSTPKLSLALERFSFLHVFRLRSSVRSCGRAWVVSSYPVYRCSPLPKPSSQGQGWDGCWVLRLGATTEQMLQSALCASQMLHCASQMADPHCCTEHLATQYPEQSHKKQPLLQRSFSLSRMYSTHIWCAVKKNCCWQQLVKNVHTSLLSVRCCVTQDLEGYSADLPQTVKVSSNVHFGLNFEFWISYFQPGLSLDSWKVGYFIIIAMIRIAIRVDQSIT